jgi:AraC family transcriptional regulator of adaptative response/methylated-DNA-[protein]-cysteine methyltransferase
VLAAATHKGVCAVLIGSDRDKLITDLRNHFPEAQPAQGDQLAEIVGRIVNLIENPAKSPDFKLDLRGSDLEIKIWEALRTIPPGRTLSYSELADRVGLRGVPKAAKNVADACAGNKIAVAIPCHRILRKDGSISGYRWGVRRKRALLEREGAQ